MDIGKKMQEICALGSLLYSRGFDPANPSDSVLYGIRIGIHVPPFQDSLDYYVWLYGDYNDHVRKGVDIPNTSVLSFISLDDALDQLLLKLQKINCIR